MGWVIVEFEECREVIVNGVSHGDNIGDGGYYNILRVGEGLQTFALGGAADYKPPEQKAEVAVNTPLTALHVVFTKKSS